MTRIRRREPEAFTYGLPSINVSSGEARTAPVALLHGATFSCMQSAAALDRSDQAQRLHGYDPVAVRSREVPVEERVAKVLSCQGPSDDGGDEASFAASKKALQSHGYSWYADCRELSREIAIDGRAVEAWLDENVYASRSSPRSSGRHVETIAWSMRHG